MNKSPRTRALVAGVGVVLALGVGTAAVIAADGDTVDPPVPMEPDGGIGDTPIPVEPDGGIGDTPIPVEPDGGIGDTPGDEFSVDQPRDDAHGLLGRFTVELDGDGFRVTSVTVELPDGPETLKLRPG